MAKPTRPVVALFAVLLMGVIGCSRSETTGGSARTPSTTAAPAAASPSAASADIRYVLPEKLCQAVDDTALREIFPIDGGKPLVDSAGLCDTSRASPSMAVSFTVNAQLTRDSTWGQRYYDTARRLAKGTPTDVSGAGSAAFWIGDKNKVELVTYHGNLALHVICATINDNHRLPADVPARLVRVAAGTFARLAP